MKRKQEILNQIAELRLEGKSNKSIPKALRTHYEDILNGQIRALRWALGYKTGSYYFCVYCQRPHKNFQCPYCGEDA